MKPMKSFQNTLSSVIIVLLLTIVSGCDDAGIVDKTNNNGNSGNTTVSVMADNTAYSNPVEINISEAKVLITEVELETEPSGTSHHVRIEAFVIQFNMGGILISVTSGDLPLGTYNKIKFKIHKPEDNETPPDPEFKEGQSGNQRFSFIIKGTYSGNSFVYKSKKSASLVINLNKPVNFQNGTKNFTIIVNPSFWFNNGKVVIDPRNPSNDDIIDDNLRTSFKKAFEDNDKNGLPDDN